MADKEEIFCCPICGSNTYGKIYINKSIGRVVFGEKGVSSRELLYYVCTGCSVHFANPKKFTKSKE